jgi:hypothetical protein
MQSGSGFEEKERKGNVMLMIISFGLISKPKRGSVI